MTLIINVIYLIVVEAEKAKIKKATTRLETFWKQHDPLLRNAPKGSKLHDVARLTYTVKEKIIPDDVDDNELRVSWKYYRPLSWYGNLDFLPFKSM